MKLKALNLYAGLGGNRKLWSEVDVTAVESNMAIAMLYAQCFPKDKVHFDDAHRYLLLNHTKFDFVWSSPPCQSHSQMNYYLKEKRYPDMQLYEEIIFLKTFCKVPWVVENVKGYYAPLIAPTFTHGHPIQEHHWPMFGSNSNERETMMKKLKWLGFELEYSDFKGIARPRQVVDNCVAPYLGLHILNSCHLK